MMGFTVTTQLSKIYATLKTKTKQIRILLLPVSMTDSNSYFSSQQTWYS